MPMPIPLLSATLFTPLLGALLVLLVPKRRVGLVRAVGLLAALAALALCGAVAWEVAARGPGEMQLLESRPWVPDLGLTYALGADGLSAPLIALTGLLCALAMFYSAFTVSVRVKEYVLLFLLLETGVLGVFMALDMVLFYLFYELGLVPMFLLIAVWGGAHRERAALKFFIYTLAGSVLGLLGILAVANESGTFNVLQAAAARPFAADPRAATLAFWALFIAFAVKIPLFPFHTWLPDAHTAAPTAGSVLLAGLLLKLGGYGMLRFVLPLFPERCYHFSVEVPVITVLALCSIVYGALVCLAQWDLKRLVATSSVAHMGYVTLGLATASAGWRGAAGWGGADAGVLDAAAAGLTGAALQQISHGLITGALFFLVGMLYERAHTRDLKAFGGLASVMPVFYGLTLVTALASLGLPGLVGFWSELAVFRGAIRLLPLAAAVGVLGVVLTAAYVLWKLVGVLLLGTLDRGRWGGLRDLSWWEQLTLWPLVALMVLLGLYPAPLINTLNAAALTLLRGTAGR